MTEHRMPQASAEKRDPRDIESETSICFKSQNGRGWFVAKRVRVKPQQ